jgi:uncharacterized RDD family membrane protein YckC
MVSDGIRVPIASGEPRPAAFARRAAAVAIDVSVFVGVQIAIGMRFGTQDRPWQWRTTGLLGCALILFTPMYWVLPETFFGKGLGKLLLGLRVWSLDGKEPTSLQLLKRSACKLLELPIGFTPSLLMAMTNPLRQSPGDRWAGTLVCNEEDIARWRAGGLALPFSEWLRSLRR